jgi:hypothetical protein
LCFSITDDISLGQRQLFVPDQVTPGQSFHVKYCSSTYFKTSSNNIILAVSREQGNFDGATVIAQRDDYTEGYDFDVTLQDGGITFAENSYFQVIEVINDYYTVCFPTFLCNQCS